MENTVSSTTPAVRTKGLDEVFCGSCGEAIKAQAEICPKCGVRQRQAGKQISKGVLLLLTFFLGGLGAHKFYVGKTGVGILYLLFFWTFIPAFIALIEFIVYAFTDEEKLQSKYQSKGKGGAAIAIVLACVIGLVMVIILAAVAVPLYVGYTKSKPAATSNQVIDNSQLKTKPAATSKRVIDNSHSKQSQVSSVIEKAGAGSLSRPQKNAARSAKQYLSMAGFSRDGLIQQLSSDAGEGYSVADATIAVDNLNIDWNQQAVRSAKQYLSMQGFSCDGLIQQLSSSAGEKYTVSQATYGARQAGACD